MLAHSRSAAIRRPTIAGAGRTRGSHMADQRTDPMRTDPLRIESRAVTELAQLHSAPIFYGRGAPRGDGRVVLVVPGLFGNDVYLGPLRGWLRRIGYTPVRSSLVVNA